MGEHKEHDHRRRPSEVRARGRTRRSSTIRGGLGIPGHSTSGTEPSVIGMTDDTVLATTAADRERHSACYLSTAEPIRP
jgi:hypothetical protein